MDRNRQAAPAALSPGEDQEACGSAAPPKRRASSAYWEAVGDASDVVRQVAARLLDQQPLGENQANSREARLSNQAAAAFRGCLAGCIMAAAAAATLQTAVGGC